MSLTKCQKHINVAKLMPTNISTFHKHKLTIGAYATKVHQTDSRNQIEREYFWIKFKQILT